MKWGIILHGFGETSSKIFIIAIIVFALLSIVFNMIMRKLLKIKKKEPFSYNHVNKTHKRIDWIIRITSLILLLVTSTYNLSVGFSGNHWYTDFGFVMISYLLISEIFRAFMEWKYLPNEKDYILTISYLGFCMIFLLIV